MYDLPRDNVRGLLLPLIGVPGIELAGKRLYHRVFKLYTSLPINYVDAFHAALMESRQRTEVYSYDADFDRIGGLQTMEP